MTQQDNRYGISGEAAEEHYRKYEKSLNDRVTKEVNNYEAMIRQMAEQTYKAALKSGKPHKDSQREASAMARNRLLEDHSKNASLIADLKKRLETRSNPQSTLMIEQQLALAIAMERKIENLLLESLIGPTRPTEVRRNPCSVKTIIAAIIVILLLVILL